MMQFQEIKSLLQKPKKIVITSHRNPDGDAIGSSLGLYHVLIQLGHQVTVIVPSEYPDFLSWMDGTDKIMVHDNGGKACNNKVKEANIIFCLDFNSLKRIDNLGMAVEKNKSAVKVLIDHHLYPDDFADYTISKTTASSTCELIYDFITDLNLNVKINNSSGECIYTGLVTDTGSFKHATNPNVFKIAGELLQKGIDDTQIQEKIFNSDSEKRLRLLGYALNKMVVIPESKTAYIALDKIDHDKFNIKRGDTEGIVNMMLRIKDIHIAALITEQQKMNKLSLRSKGDISVEEICRTHFNGGGHKNASGGSEIGTDFTDTINKFEKVIKSTDSISHE